MKDRSRSGAPDPSRILSRFDSDEDGKISREEATGPMAQRFDQADANEDGFVTKEELVNSFERRREK
jgi:Ca2+-binding EF-hand superfamily protein